jgi:hypothetical protein
MTPEPGGEPPRLLRRPSDAPPPLEHISGTESLAAVRREVSSRRQPGGASRRGTARAWAGRLTGRSRRRLLLALGAATLELAEHCDRLTDRLSSLEGVTEDVAATLGEELARLRAEVLHLRALTTSLERRSPDA